MEATALSFNGGRVVCLLVVVVLVMAACTRAGGRLDGPAAAPGTLAGRIVRGPISPIGGPGITAPPSVPAADAELRILDLNSGAIATARADRDGHYRVTLPPGNYRVERGANFSGIAKSLPATVAISPGVETRLDVLIDTGIR
jgi:hypothetical protein